MLYNIFVSEFDDIMAKGFDRSEGLAVELYSLLLDFRSTILQGDVSLIDNPRSREQLEILEALVIEAYVAIKSNECVSIHNADQIKKMTMMDIHKKIQLFDEVPGDIIRAVQFMLPGSGLNMDPSSDEYQQYEKEWFEEQPNRLEAMILFNKFNSIVSKVCRDLGVSDEVLSELINYLYLYYDASTGKLCLTIEDASDEYIMSEISALLTNGLQVEDVVDAINRKMV